MSMIMRQRQIPFFSFGARVILAWFLTVAITSPMALIPAVTAMRFDSGNAPGKVKISKKRPAKSLVNKRQINPVPISCLSAASFEAAIAPDSIVTAFGTLLATRVEAAALSPLPTTLAGTTVKVTDSAGTERLAPLFFVSPNQINYNVPAETAPGQAFVEVRSGDGTISQGTLNVKAVAPAIFSANADGRGVPAANLLRIKPDGAQMYESLAEFDTTDRRFKTKAIDPGLEGDRLFLILYLTGIRGASDPNRDGNLNESFRFLLAGVQTSPLFAGPLPGFVGLDQLNAEIPRSLAGRGRVSLAIAAPGFNTSNLCEIEIAPLRGLTPPQITSFSEPSALAGRTITINGSGFSPNPVENLVRIGGVEASVKSANIAQLQVIVPFGAETGRISVRTPGGEAISANALSIRTSISGVIENTARQPLRGVTVSLNNSNITATTDDEGVFLLPDVPPGRALIAIGPNTITGSTPYPKVRLTLNVAANRDNQFSAPIALQRVGNRGIQFPQAGLEKSEHISASPEESSNFQSGNVTLEIPVGARISYFEDAFPGGLYLSVVERSRMPVALPAGQYSSTIAQIFPFGTTIEPGAKLIFPNSDGLPAGTEAKLYRFDQQPGSPTTGQFVEAGTATVTADGQRIETPDGVITEATYYFVSAARATTTVIGRVVEKSGNPARRVAVSARGQQVFTDGNGGFTLRNVSVKTGDQIFVEATFHRPKGRVDRVLRESVAVTAGGVTSVAPDIVLPEEDVNRPPVLVILPTLTATAGQTTEFDFAAYDREGRVVNVTASGASFASVISRSDTSYTLRLTPGSNEEREYPLTLTATDDQNLSYSQVLSLNVVPPPPLISDFNPKSARPGSLVKLTGRSLKSGNNNPQISFAGIGGKRIRAMVVAASPSEVQVIVPNGAATGIIDLINDYGVPAQSDVFTVIAGPDFELIAVPSTAIAPQGGSATYVVNLKSADANFTQLAALSVSGLPAGAKSSFNPEQITAGASSTLTLSAGSISAASYPFTIKAKINADGVDVERSVSATVTVQATGQTSLSGRVLSMKAEPLGCVTVAIGEKSTVTDASGSFLLIGAPSGNQVVYVQADNPVAKACHPGRTYPNINEPVEIKAGVNEMPYTFYLPEIDRSPENIVSYVPTQNVEVTTKMVPGLKLMIPAGTNLLTRDGRPPADLTLSCVEIDRTPAPLPTNISTAMVYTAQPGGARPAMRPDGTRPRMPVVYPNLMGEVPGKEVNLWYFNHDLAKWEVYGKGVVSDDGRNIMPRPGVGLPDFSWHFPQLGDGGNTGADGPGNRDGEGDDEDSNGEDDDSEPDEPNQCPETGNMVNLSTGIKIERMTDIVFGGARGGLRLRRIHTSNLAGSCDGCAFSRGWTHNYNIRLGLARPLGTGLIGAVYLVMPWDGRGRMFSRVEPNLYRAPTTTNRLGDEIRLLSDGRTFEYRYKHGKLMRFVADNATNSIVARLTEITDRNGNKTMLGYTGANLTVITDAVGRTITLTYTGGRITKATDPLGREWTYDYDGANRLKAVTDPMKFTTSYGYDTFSRLASVTNRRGHLRKEVKYDANGRVSEQKFADGSFERYAYGLSGTTVTSATITNSLSRTRSLRFNSAGYVIGTTDELGQTGAIERDVTTNQTLSVTGPCGCVESKRQFDERGNLKVLADRRGKETKYDYHPTFNFLIGRNDRNNHGSKWDYDPLGNLRTYTDARGKTSTFTWDRGQLKTATDPLNHTTSFEYHENGYLRERRDHLQHKTTYKFDRVGRLKEISDHLGRTVTIEYDSNDRIKSVADPAKVTTTFDYDENDNLKSVTNKLGKTWSFEYDTRNRLTSRRDPVGNVSRYQYNSDDELIAATSPSGRVTRYEYDPRGLVKKTIDPLGGEVEYGYDNVGNLLTLKDQRGNITTWGYDELYRVANMRDPLGRVTNYEYDPVGNLIKKIDRLGRMTVIEPDELNRPKKTTYADAVVTYQYDDAYRLKRIDDTQSGFIEWEYDEANRMKSEKTPAGTVSYEYNEANQRRELRVLDRPPVTYKYDSAGRLENIIQTLNQFTETFTWVYDDLSRMKELRRPNNVTTVYEYDDANRLQRLLHKNPAGNAIEDFQYAYNPDDEIESITSLASATLLPTAKNVGQADAANRITQFGPLGLSFDDEGQTKGRADSRGTAIYEWDARGRLKKATMPDGQTVSYGYDALGRRSNRAADEVKTDFVYDGSDVVLDRVGGNTVDYLNGFGIDDKLRLLSTSFGAFYFLHDHLGSMAALVNGAAGVIERSQYEAFGVNAPGYLTRYGFTGRERDLASGLMYYRARWYDSQQGRFLGEDPIRLFGGDLHFYSYVWNDPINITDPNGLEPKWRWHFDEDESHGGPHLQRERDGKKERYDPDTLEPRDKKTPPLSKSERKNLKKDTEWKKVEKWIERGRPVRRAPGVLGPLKCIPPLLLLLDWVEWRECQKNWECRCANDPYCT